MEIESQIISRAILEELTGTRGDLKEYQMKIVGNKYPRALRTENGEAYSRKFRGQSTLAPLSMFWMASLRRILM